MKTLNHFFKVILALSLTCVSSSGFAANEVQDAKALRKRLGVDKYEPEAYDLANVKVAVLDTGFAYFESNKGMLPDSAVLIMDPSKPKELTAKVKAGDKHGLGMAQILWAVTGRSKNGPKIYLLNVVTLTNLKDAVDFIIKEKIDIVLYSTIWQGVGNFDGAGPINDEVNRATEQGVIWINAAGNESKKVFNRLIDENIRRKGQFLTLKDGKDYIQFKNKVDENNVEIILNWSDYKDRAHLATKDLDIFVYNENGDLIGSGEKIQRGEAPPEEGESDLSKVAQEKVTFSNLDRGTYQIKIKAKSDNFLPKDSLRVLVSVKKPDTIDFIDRTTDSEVFPPADNPSVFAVGENTQFSAEGMTRDRRMKPNVILDNAVVSFTNGDTEAGSSSAAAIIAGEVVLLKAMCSSLDFDRLNNYAMKLTSQVKQNDEDLSVVEETDSDVKKLANFLGGDVPRDRRIMRADNGHLVVLTKEDPGTLNLFKGAKKDGKTLDLSNVPSDATIVIYKDNEGKYTKFGIYEADSSGTSASKVKDDQVEFRKLKSAVGIWKAPKASNACLTK